RLTAKAERVDQLEAELESARSKPSSDASQEVLVLKSQLAETQAAQDAKMQEMFKGIMGAITENAKAPVAAAGTSPDLEKQLKGLQSGILQQLQKMGGANFKYDGAGGDSVDVGALMARNANTAPLESNIKDTTIKEQSAQG